ncbi:hypothetical protein [Tessaracoccus sp. ZS01]|uniref:DUF7691 family protein n=1 Tax=Tessaracoccus sp. ZS01 TaxID=1906324 RepID=UPI00096F2A35|nr:hypothetical protein [Tessaracoccus sp. ZS01]MCG6568629.1 hypothetical protein [Tessaracoccus sp. ZS01]OMG52228.1 hypothetical protein BJN44_13495 [Tessaracoccus sp. ZS01]
MHRLVVYAISIDEVRDIFRAPVPLAERLRAVAAERFAAPQPSRRHWFGPLMRRDPANEVDPSLPQRTDVDALLTGAYIPPDRMAPSWHLFQAWLDELSAARRDIPWDAETFDRVEWDLARGGLNSDYSLRSLADRQLAVPLRPLPGQVVGYAKRVHAVEALEDYRRVLTNPELSDEARSWLQPVVEVLEAVASDERLDVAVVGTDS